jgi:hypothetical protein
MQQPKRYKLLKDLPGCPATNPEKVFSQELLDRDEYVTRWERLKTNTVCKCFLPKPCLHMTADAYFTQPAFVVENNPDFFQPIPDEPERPYPWQPSSEEKAFVVNAQMSGRRGEQIVGGYIAPYACYRTKEDAELRLKVGSLLNRAVQALINRQGWAPTEGGHMYFVETYCLRPYAVVESIFRGDGRKRERLSAGFYFATREDAQAVADLYNFFLTNHHEQ